MSRKSGILYLSKFKILSQKSTINCCINILNIAQGISERKDKQADPCNSG